MSLKIVSMLVFVLGTASHVLAAASVPSSENNDKRKLKDLSKDIVDNFRSKNHLKSAANPDIQHVLAGDAFALDNTYISLNSKDLTPVDVFTPNAKVLTNGVEGNISVAVFLSKQDPTVTITMGSTGKLVSATRGTTSVYEVAGGSGMYATVRSSDFDDIELAKLHVKEKTIPSGGRLLRNPFLQQDFTQESGRFLQTIGTCSSYGFDVVEVMIVVESLLCQVAGGTASAASALAQSVVAEASKFYEVDGLCKKLRISHLEIYCDALSDPIRPLIDRSGTADVCTTDADGLLQNFVRYVNGTPVRADANLLLHGKVGLASVTRRYHDTPNPSYVSTSCHERLSLGQRQ
jgi:hypothetical protein